MARSLYYGHPKTQSLVAEAHRCISEVHLSTTLATGPSAPHRPGYLPKPSTPQLSYLGNAMDAGHGSGGPSTPISLGYNPHDAYPPIGAPPIYLPPQQGLGTGQFFDHSVSASPTLPSKMSPYPQIETHEPAPRRSLDDFGVNVSTPSGPAEGTNGRFATYPGKGNTSGMQGGYTLRNGSPSLGGSHEGDGPSVADALGPSQEPPNATPGELGSIHNPATDYEAPMYAPPQGPSSWNATHKRGNPSNASQDDAVLAYTAMDEQQGEGQGHDDERHVRFGEVSDVDEEIERRGGPHQPSSSHQQHAPPAMRSSLDSGGHPSLSYVPC